MIVDRNNVVIKDQDLCFYTERPHSNYADALYKVYEWEGVLKVGCLIVHGLNGKYTEVGLDPENDLNLDDYASNTFYRPTGKTENLTVLVDFPDWLATVDSMDHLFPLNALSLKNNYYSD